MWRGAARRSEPRCQDAILYYLTRITPTTVVPITKIAEELGKCGYDYYYVRRVLKDMLNSGDGVMRVHRRMVRVTIEPPRMESLIFHSGGVEKFEEKFAPLFPSEMAVRDIDVDAEEVIE